MTLLCQRHIAFRNRVADVSDEQSFHVGFRVTEPPGRDCRSTAEALHLEGIVEVVAQHCTRSARDHAEVAQQIGMVVLAVSSDQLRRTPAACPQVQSTRRPGRAGQIARLLDEFARTARHPARIPCPDIAREVFAPATVAVRPVAVLVERRHRACDIVPDARQMTLLVVAEHLRVAAARRGRKRSVRVPGVDFRQSCRAVDDLRQSARPVVGVCSVVGRHAVRHHKRRFPAVRLIVGVRAAVGLRAGSGLGQQVVCVVVTEARHIAARQFRDLGDTVAVIVDRRV